MLRSLNLCKNGVRYFRNFSCSSSFRRGYNIPVHTLSITHGLQPGFYYSTTNHTSSKTDPHGNYKATQQKQENEAVIEMNKMLELFFRHPHMNNNRKPITMVMEALIRTMFENPLFLKELPKLCDFLNFLAEYIKNSKEPEGLLAGYIFTLIASVPGPNAQKLHISSGGQILGNMPDLKLVTTALQNLYTHFEELKSGDKVKAVVQAAALQGPDFADLKNGVIKKSIQYLKTAENEELDSFDMDSAKGLLMSYQMMQVDTRDITKKLGRIIIAGYKESDETDKKDMLVRLKLIAENKFTSPDIMDIVCEDILSLITKGELELKDLVTISNSYAEVDDKQFWGILTNHFEAHKYTAIKLRKSNMHQVLTFIIGSTRNQGRLKDSTLKIFREYIEGVLRELKGSQIVKLLEGLRRQQESSNQELIQKLEARLKEVS